MKKKRNYSNSENSNVEKESIKSSKNENNLILNFKKFWKFIWYDDSLLSYLINFGLAFLVIKYIFFPSIGYVLNNDYPIVAIVSGSMEHKIVNNQICDKFIVDINYDSLSFDEWWSYCGSYYVKNFNLNSSDFENYDYKNGLNIGDVMVLYGKEPKDIEVGEILVFIPGDKNWFESHGPVIHRVVKKWEDAGGKYHFQTKGDHNRESTSIRNFESDIGEEDVIGVAVFRVPFIGYVKLWLSQSLSGVIGIFR